VLERSRSRKVRFLRILFLNPITQLGGAERILLDVIASLREALPAGSSMHMILLADGPLRAAAEALGVNVQLAPIPSALARTGSNVSPLRLLARSVIGAPSIWRFTRRLRAICSLQNVRFRR